MGFANMVSSCSIHVSIAQNSENFVTKLQSFNQRRKTHFVNFNLARNSKRFQRIEVGSVSCCKRSELIDFEERKSANEVMSILSSHNFS
ncbi:Aspartate 1-decarboxylase [Bienertia sinuspersici]